MVALRFESISEQRRNWALRRTETRSIRFSSYTSVTSQDEFLSLLLQLGPTAPEDGNSLKFFRAGTGDYLRQDLAMLRSIMQTNG